MPRYGIKDVFATLQGEGKRAGTKSVFVRFTGCNLWDGLPLHRDRGVGACSKWCDTDFFKGKAIDTDELIALMGEAWGTGARARDGARWCVLSGGEPCLQIDAGLLSALHDYGWKVSIETNGTVANEAVARHADWVCVAPKLGNDGEMTTLRMSRADEIKVVLPGAAPGQPGWTDEQLEDLTATWPHAELFVQPQDPLVAQDLVEETALKRSREVERDIEEELEQRFRRNLKRCLSVVMRDPRWALSMQMHKFIDVP